MCTDISLPLFLCILVEISLSLAVKGATKNITDIIKTVDAFMITMKHIFNAKREISECVREVLLY